MSAASDAKAFYEITNAAINDMIERGFDSEARLTEWLQKLEQAARLALVPEAVLVRTMADALARIYDKTVDTKRLLKIHKGISHYTLAAIKPKLRAELDRRILASAGLIKLNRKASIQRTLQRFQGWSTSIPPGGTRVADRAEVKKTIRKSIAGLPFEERRVIIDQGHKLISAVNEIVAVDGGAIAAVWRHVNEGGGYQARKEHEDRDGKVFLFRNSWAMQKGLVKLAGHQYTDQIEQPAELPFCRCSYVWLYALRDLPPEMLTAKGKETLIAVRKTIAAWSA